MLFFGVVDGGLLCRGSRKKERISNLCEREGYVTPETHYLSLYVGLERLLSIPDSKVFRAEDGMNGCCFVRKEGIVLGRHEGRRAFLKVSSSFTPFSPTMGKVFPRCIVGWHLVCRIAVLTDYRVLLVVASNLPKVPFKCFEVSSLRVF